jgi:hypothetical protein
MTTPDLDTIMTRTGDCASANNTAAEDFTIKEIDAFESRGSAALPTNRLFSGQKSELIPRNGCKRRQDLRSSGGSAAKRTGGDSQK